MTQKYPTGYGPVHPQADYRPWENDTTFEEVYLNIAAATMLDKMRCYSLWRLLEQCAGLPGDILEVGVWRGGSGALLTARATMLPALSDRRVYLADSFHGVVKAGPRDSYYRGGEHADTSVEQVQEVLERLKLSNYHILQGIFPDQTAAEVAAEHICFCHIDVDVYRSAYDVVEWVWPRMPVGAVLVYDDYGFYGCEGVTTLGNEEYAKPDRIFIHNLNGQGVVIKTHV